MADFKKSQSYILKNEGFYALIHGDKGGETYCGISRVFHPDWIGWDVIDGRPHPIVHNTHYPDLDGAVDDWYYENEWKDINGDSISSQAIATYFYDWHVNSGGAVKQVQKVIGVNPDGQFGNKSIAALNSKDWLLEIHMMRLAYYKSLNQPQFEKQWMQRAENLYNELI